ncbi:MAG: hypothetical protein MZV64_04455 [Ignavibacteriales bacterium]|nr:hypothetical protein [Ignavibacteriales bacterium]
MAVKAKYYVTENGGQDWDEIDIGSVSGLYKVSLDNNGEGIVFSNRGEIFFSYDSGKTLDKKTVGQTLIFK